MISRVTIIRSLYVDTFHAHIVSGTEVSDAFVHLLTVLCVFLDTCDVLF